MEALMPLVRIVQDVGTLAVLVLLVWRAPDILSKFSLGVQMLIQDVQKVQQEVLKASDAQIDKLIKSSDVRFASIESVLREDLEQNRELIKELVAIKERLSVLEWGNKDA